MTKKLKIGILFRVSTALIVAAPLISSIIVGCLLNHFLGWEGKAFFVVLAGGLTTLTLFLALAWIMGDCESQIKDWMNVTKDEKPRPEAGAWKTNI